MNIVDKDKRNKKIRKITLKILRRNSNKKGYVLKLRILTPRKPNSAKRPTAKIGLVNWRKVVCHIPGIGHNLKKYARVLVRGGGPRDLPGVWHDCSRGVYDFLGVRHKTRRRSIYSVEKPFKGPRRQFKVLLGLKFS